MGGVLRDDEPQGRDRDERADVAEDGAPKAVHLLFDTVNNRIGVKPTAAGLANAVRVGIRGKCGGRVVRAYPLMQEFRIHIPETLRFYDADIDDDGVLILDLRTARVPPGVRRRNDRLKEAARAARGEFP
jgi:hypothetical protein